MGNCCVGEIKGCRFGKTSVNESIFLPGGVSFLKQVLEHASHIREIDINFNPFNSSTLAAVFEDLPQSSLRLNSLQLFPGDPIHLFQLALWSQAVSKDSKFEM
jgi:hypothetical protein